MNRRPMRLAAVAGEAWRNVTTATTRTLILFATAAAGMAGLAIADTVTTGHIAADAATFHQAGAATLILSTPGGLVDGTTCDQLTDTAGITAAGAIRAAPAPLQPAATPQQTIPLYQVTPGFAAVIGADTAVGITLAKPAAKQYAHQFPARLATSSGPVVLGGAYPFPDDGRTPTLGYAALVQTPADTGPFDACWATIWPADTGKQVLLYATLATSPPPQADISVTQLNNTLGQSFNGANLLAERTTRYGPAVAAAIGIILTIGSARLRRLELAAARHLGVTRTALACQLLLETAYWAPAAGITAAAATITTGIALHTSAATIALGSKAIITGTAGCLTGAALAGATTSPRHLVRYFQHR